MRACFGLRHEGHIYTSHTRATANRWSGDDSLCMCERNCGPTSSLSVLISNQPTTSCTLPYDMPAHIPRSATPLLRSYLMSTYLQLSGFLNHCKTAPRLRQRSRFCFDSQLCLHFCCRKNESNLEDKRNLSLSFFWYFLMQFSHQNIEFSVTRTRTVLSIHSTRVGPNFMVFPHAVEHRQGRRYEYE